MSAADRSRTASSRVTIFAKTMTNPPTPAWPLNLAFPPRPSPITLRPCGARFDRCCWSGFGKQQLPSGSTRARCVPCWESRFEVSWLPDSVVDHLREAVTLPDFTGTRYEVIGEIGRGGMGAVYVGRDLQLDRRVALKVLTVVDGDGQAAPRM